MPLGLLLVTMLYGCSVRETQDRPGNMFAYLPDSEVDTLKKKAAAGDGKAAYDVATYYSFWLADMAKSDRWMRRSARLGYPPAIRYIHRFKERFE
jgi:TPR repeat protein